MNSFSSRKMNEALQEAQREVHQPSWLEDFLGKKFIDVCPSHSTLRNIYCINCKVSSCQHCMSAGSHKDHQTLKVYKNVHKDVVCLDAMQPYIDCSKIQPFKSNHRLVLNCRPRCGSTLDDAASCNNGSRRSKVAQEYNYCSISCMVKALASEPPIPPIVPIQAPPPPPPQESQGTTSGLSYRKRKRKGIPHRAPLF